MTGGADGGFWHAVGAQLADPRGPAGRLTGWMMGFVNRGPNRLVREALALEPHHCLLDVGCGAGQAIADCLPYCDTVFGVDRSPTMVAAARRRNRVQVATGRSAITAGRAEALPYPDRRFDRVMASNVMYFWEDIPAAVAELHRVLRPGGRIVLYVTDARSMRDWSFARTGTHRLYEADELEALLRDAAAGRLAVRVEAARLFGGIRGLVATLTEDRVAGRSEPRRAPTL